MRPGIALLALLAAAAPTSGQLAPGDPLAAAASATGALKLDGRLDEPAWAAARPIGPLTQVEPREGAEASEATEVLVLRDAANLYFGIRCRDRTPSGIVATRMGRDHDLEQDDHVMVVLDTFGDRRNGFFFLVNPRGARGEGQISNNDERLNYDWDGIWDAAARIDAEGWTAELAIPFKTLRFKAGQQGWGLNVQRQIERRLETDRWSATRRDIWISNLSEAGRLEGLADARQGRGLDIRPYGFAGDEDGSTTFKLGADVFQNVTPNLTASLTLNTDFAETEVDERQVNLTRFPLFYPEKRSFFLEGAGIYEVAGLGRNADLVPFYSRRIGLVEGQEVEVLAGAKLSGRVDRWNVGFLDVVTRAQHDLGLARQNLLSARVSRNLFEQSFVGALVTHGNPEGTGRNTLLGADARFATSSFQGDKNLSLDLFAFVTDDEATGRRGHAWGGKLDYPNDLWDVALTFKEIDDDFAPALGFVRRTGIRKTTLGAAFMPRPGRLGIRQMSVEVRPQYVSDLDGRALDWIVRAIPLGLQFETGDQFELGFNPQYERLDEEYEIQPGIVVPTGEYRYTSWVAALETAQRRRVALDVAVRWGRFYDGDLTVVESELAFKPSPHLLVGFGGEWGEGKMPAGNFKTRVFAGRIDVSFTPNLAWSTLVQYDSDSRILGGQSRLRWRIRPGSDLFVVFNRGWLRDEDGSYGRYFDRGSAKLQHTFRF